MNRLILLLTLLLVACGGGGGGGTAADNASTTTTTTSSSTSSVADIVLPTWTVIADANFERALIAMGLDDTVDGRVLTSNISSITQLSIRKEYYNPTTASGITFSSIFSDNGYAYATGSSNLITDVTGLENFKSLRVLWFDNQKATNFDFSNMKNLQFLSLWQAPITSIDVSSLTKLKLLGLGETSLTTVDISKLVNLEEVNFQQDNNGVLPYTTTNGTTVGGFTSLDFTNNTKLQRIYIIKTNVENALINLNINELLSEESKNEIRRNLNEIEESLESLSNQELLELMTKMDEKYAGLTQTLEINDNDNNEEKKMEDLEKMLINELKIDIIII